MIFRFRRIQKSCAEKQHFKEKQFSISTAHSTITRETFKYTNAQAYARDSDATVSWVRP